MRYALPLLFLAAVPSSVAAAPHGGVAGSKHDLSTGGPGPIRAMSETNPCAFCHLPHVGGNDVATGPGVDRMLRTRAARCGGAPGGRAARRGSAFPATTGRSRWARLWGGDIRTNIAAIPSGRPSNLGTDLRKGHPVSFVPAPAGGDTRPPPPGDPVKLDRRGELQCTSCHDPHQEYGGDPVVGMFLAKSAQNSELCLTCHEAARVSPAGASHAGSSALIVGRTGERPPGVGRLGGVRGMPSSTRSGAERTDARQAPGRRRRGLPPLSLRDGRAGERRSGLDEAVRPLRQRARRPRRRGGEGRRAAVAARELPGSAASRHLRGLPRSSRGEGRDRRGDGRRRRARGRLGSGPLRPAGGAGAVRVRGVPEVPRGQREQAAARRRAAGRLDPARLGRPEPPDAALAFGRVVPSDRAARPERGRARAEAAAQRAVGHLLRGLPRLRRRAGQRWRRPARTARLDLPVPPRAELRDAGRKRREPRARTRSATSATTATSSCPRSPAFRNTGRTSWIGARRARRATPRTASPASAGRPRRTRTSIDFDLSIVQVRAGSAATGAWGRAPGAAPSPATTRRTTRSSTDEVNMTTNRSLDTARRGLLLLGALAAAGCVSTRGRPTEEIRWPLAARRGPREVRPRLPERRRSPRERAPAHLAGAHRGLPGRGRSTSPPGSRSASTSGRST